MFSTQCKLIINNVEIIACKLVLFKNTIIGFINQEISAERERSIAIVSYSFKIGQNMPLLFVDGWEVRV